jgi:hypothetical protein
VVKLRIQGIDAQNPRGGTLQTVNLALQGDDVGVQGLAFDAQGKLLVGTSEGTVYKTTVS